MEGLAAYIGLPVILLLATWGAFGTVLKTFEMLNKTRNVILGISKDGRDLTPKFRELLLWSDWIPLQVGFDFALFVYSAVFAITPFVFTKIMAAQRAGPRAADVPQWTQVMTAPWIENLSILGAACYLIATFATITLIGNILGGIMDYGEIRRMIKNERAKASNAAQEKSMEK